MYIIYDVWVTHVLGNSAAVYVFADCFWPNYKSRCEIALAWFGSFRKGVSYHWVAGEGRLEFEDLVETSCLCLCKLLLCHAHHKLHCGVGVVFLIVADQRRSFICSLEHGLQNWLLIRLEGKKYGISGITSVSVKRPSFIKPRLLQVILPESRCEQEVQWSQWYFCPGQTLLRWPNIGSVPAHEWHL